ncbi:MAG: adenylate/guanylate cyclase domain-containing protein, partial [Myxococcota bacterium]
MVVSSNIGQWLEGLGLGQYAEEFADNDIDFRALPHVDDQDLRELGISLGHRRVLLAAIASFAESAATPQDRARELEPPRESTAERRQLTVMFCDLVGSTELSERLDPEDLREVLRAYQETCANCVGRFDGYIAKYIGDGLLVYFGYPQAHEDDARRAVSAGLDIVAGMANLNQRLGDLHGVELRVRVGIHTGLVVAGEMGSGAMREADAIVGRTPNVAARLERLAEPNSVTISAATQRLVAGLFECDDLGPQHLRGISKMVSVFRVRGESDAPSRFEAAARRGLPPIVGRASEIGLVVDRWSQAKEGEAQTLLLSGEAGIGKSRIVRAICERLENEPHSRILYYCSPYHQNSALYPVIVQFERALRFETSDTDEEKLDKLESALAELSLPKSEMAPLLATLLSLPIEGRYPAIEASPQLLRRKILEALLSIIEAMAAATPVLMVVEDAHWADPSTLELLGLLVDRLRRARVLLLVNSRPEFEAPWRAGAQVTTLGLNRLSRKESAALIARVAHGKTVPIEVFEQIV